MFDINPPSRAPSPPPPGLKVLHQWEWSKMEGRNPFKLLTKGFQSTTADKVWDKKGFGRVKGRADGRTGPVEDVFRTR